MEQVIVHEPRTYRLNGEHSYFRDRAIAASGIFTANSQAAEARLRQHGREVDVEVQNRSAEGLRAMEERAWGMRDAEQRAVSSTTAVGFTTPQYIISEWAAYRSADRTYVNQTLRLPLPTTGLAVNVPSFSSAAQAAQVAENQGSPSANPTGANIPQNIVPLSGSVPVSQQLYDRSAGPEGPAFDVVIALQIKSQLDAAVDLYALTQALAVAPQVVDNTAFSVGDFYQDLALAREKLTDSVGTRLQPTHVFSTSDLYSYFSRQLDSALRPIIVPEWAAEPWSSLVATGDDRGSGWTGHILPGNIAWFTDDNIPAISANTQIIMSRPQSVITMEGDPVVFAYPETYAGQLTVLVGVREYVAVVPRFASGNAAITGTAYPTTLI